MLKHNLAVSRRAPLARARRGPTPNTLPVHTGNKSAPAASSTELSIIRRRPGAGYRHLLHRRDIERFIALVPDWPAIAQGLKTIELAAGRDDAFGYHLPGAIYLCAWDERLWLTLTREGYKEERPLLERLDVPTEARKGEVVCHFNPVTARAHQLLATLLHELGHHYDRMTTRSRHDAARGEPFAEQYARHTADLIWERFAREFLS